MPTIYEEALAPVRALDAACTRSETPCGNGSMVWRSWNNTAQAPVLVMLHGGAGSWQHWVRTIPAFTTRYQIGRAHV